MAENVMSIIRLEEQWCKWKEEKCNKFERPSSEAVKNKKREIKQTSKLTGLGGRLFPAKENEFNDPKNGKEMREYFEMQPESLDAEGSSINIKPCLIPSLSDY